jgi:hypothetical protein
LKIFNIFVKQIFIKNYMYSIMENLTVTGMKNEAAHLSIKEKISAC